eukprot:Anaeramoba_ignava/a220_84.p1 GENE.a220_84~~a220_84.p1  ORF type:complete len:676 (-),score=223.52 a220_84:50-2050(-)
MDYISDYINLPNSNTQIYKEECTECFDTIDSEKGIDVCLTCFNGGCYTHNHSARHAIEYSHPFVLNIRRIKKEKEEKEEIKENQEIQKEENSLDIFSKSQFLLFLKSKHLQKFLRKELNTEIKTTLLLIKLLEAINRTYLELTTHEAEYETERFSTSTQNIIQQNDFVSLRLTAKLVTQLEDCFGVYTGAIGKWIPYLLKSHFGFLFPFETRLRYFLMTIPDSLRTLIEFSSHLERHIEKFRNIDLGRIPRFKVRVRRDALLESAMAIMEMPQTLGRSELDIEYFDEIGFGSGPSQEFFHLVSQEIRKKELYIWLDQSEAKNEPKEPLYVESPNGLFPCPLDVSLANLVKKNQEKMQLNSNQDSQIEKESENTQNLVAEKTKEILKFFNFLGKFMARAIYDNRLLNLPFSPVFFKAIMNKELIFNDLKTIDPEFANSFSGLIELSSKYSSTKDKTLKFKGVELSSLEINFVLPGYDIELKPGGKDIIVTLDNLAEYVRLVVDMKLGKGIEEQIKWFQKGFNEILQLKSLQIFSFEEFDILINGCVEKWEPKMLMENIICEHGYTKSSEVVLYLLEFMSEMNALEQRQFLRFVTGSSSLPVGGIAKLVPHLTIVKQSTKPFENPDDYLPTVMTCANYLKIPVYSSKSVLKQKFTIAFSEGQSSFHLS